MASAERIRLLQKAPLFAGFSERELNDVVQTAKVRSFSSGETIVQEGDMAKVGFYLVLKGRVEVRKGEKKLAELGPGQFFGEMARRLSTTHQALSE